MSRIIDESDKVALQNDIFKITEWSSRWLLELNNQICQVVRFGSNETPSYFFDKEETRQIAPADEERDLGVTFDKKLTFANHIKDKITASNRALYLLRHCFHT